MRMAIRLKHFLSLYYSNLNKDVKLGFKPKDVLDMFKANLKIKTSTTLPNS